MRSTGDMLRETSGPLADLNFRTIAENRDGRFLVVPGYMKSLVEDGFRTYGGTGKITLLNCTAVNTRAGFEINGPDEGDGEDAHRRRQRARLRAGLPHRLEHDRPQQPRRHEVRPAALPPRRARLRRRAGTDRRRLRLHRPRPGDDRRRGPPRAAVHAASATASRRACRSCSASACPRTPRWPARSARRRRRTSG